MKTTETNTMTYAKLYALTYANAYNLDADTAEQLEQKIVELTASSDWGKAFWAQTVPLWRAVQQLAEARVNPEMLRQKLLHLTVSMEIAETPGDLLAVVKELSMAFD